MSRSNNDLARTLAGADAHGGVTGSARPLPDRDSIRSICDTLLSVLFPGFFARRPGAPPARSRATAPRSLALLRTLLSEQILRASRHVARSAGVAPALDARRAGALVADLLEELVAVRGLVDTDVEAAFRNDPAAQDRETILLCYPSIEALAVQRFAHRLYRRDVPIVPRMMTEVVHRGTGIDIHPGAAIDESFFIDHGTGVVIGETSRIGRGCVLYQGVSLAAFNPLAKNDRNELVRGPANKRHPDLEDRVTVYAGATILGGATVIGHHSVIGGGVFLTHSVAPHSRVKNKDPGLDITRRHAKPASSA